jgi:aminomethyltransferase
MVDFAGWEMPVQFAGIIPEHRTVREAVGIFDISHMGQLFVEGPGAAQWLDSMLTNDLAALSDGQGQYSLLLNERGGVIDDLIVYRIGAERYFLVVNASLREQDTAWLGEHLTPGIELIDSSDRFAAVAIQGPRSGDVYEAVRSGLQFPPLPPRNGIARDAEETTIICRTGYTGEDGFEIFFPAQDADSTYGTLLDAISHAGGQACGLGARDSLRLEMGYPLNGNDLSPDRTPLEAGLGFFCKLDAAAFIGREALLEQKRNGIPSRLAAIAIIGKSPPPRAHYPVLAEGQRVGELCSGTLSPSLSRGIGLAYLPADLAGIGTQLEIEIRDRRFSAQVVKKPFAKS